MGMEDGEKSNINGSAYMYTTRMCAWLNLYVYKQNVRTCASLADLHAHYIFMLVSFYFWVLVTYMMASQNC